MFVSKTVSIDIEDLIAIQNLVYKNKYTNISQFFRFALKNQIQKEFKD